MNKFDVIVIGAGASGSICAIKLAQIGINVCVIDGNEYPAKKLLVTGNGRCNLTNKNISSDFYNRKVDEYITRFDHNDTINLFKSMGLETYVDDEGRCYPISNTAKSVCFVIKNQFEKNNIKYFGNQIVFGINKSGDDYIVETEQGKFTSKYLVISTGNNDNMIKLVKSFNEEVNEFIPNLVALKTKESTKKLSGERLSNVKVWTNVLDKIIEQYGEVLFKDNGLSGISIFNISNAFAHQNFEGVLHIDLLPNIDKKQLVKLIEEKLNIFEIAGDFLQGIFSKQVCFEILKRADINVDFETKRLCCNQIVLIADIIKDMRYNIIGHYDNNQICMGGVRLESLSKNLESNKNKNLYFCGEICDVSGICGGYNLQWAFTSGYIVANDIIKNHKYK